MSDQSGVMIGGVMVTREMLEGYLADLVRQRLLLVAGKRRGRRVYQFRPGASEWMDAVEAYRKARDAGAVTEAHREQVRATWRVIKDQVELDSGQQALMDEVNIVS